tara:strand:+ start:109 stop:333 length:225 start_codon:yes stop_codon:yes gene_type:complete
VVAHPRESFLRWAINLVSPVVENVSPVAIRRIPAKRVNAKKEKNPVPIKKKTVLRKSVKSNFSYSAFFLTLKFL